MSRKAKTLGSVAAVAAAVALSGCQTVGGVFSRDNEPATSNAPQDGRISILAFEQQLAPDPALAGRTITTPPAVPVGEWPQAGGTISNQPQHASGAAILERAWRANLGAGSNKRVQIAAPPVIADGRLYFVDADQRVVALGARDGERIWARQLRPTNRDRSTRPGGIAASGPNSASPHHHTGDRVIQQGDAIVFDWGSSWKGYKSDITRTVFVGEPTEEFRRV
ncbi:MAG TPA: M24 family metallopeptidase, partial [Terricaulis sp.]|nr:M24 family metallopeptidase [Terricaulis sp.]